MSETNKDRLERLGIRRRVAAVPIQADQILGLLNGTLMVDPSGPQVLPDTEFYIYDDGDAIAQQLDPSGETYADGRVKKGKGIWLGIRASNLPEVEEGSMMPLHEVRFVSALPRET